MEDSMKSSDIAKSMTAFAIVAAFAGCSTWHSMDKTEGTALGAGGGAVAGAVVAGPVGAVVGRAGGGSAGHRVRGKDQGPRSPGYSSSAARCGCAPTALCSVA